MEYVVLNEIRSLANVLRKDEKMFAEILHQIVTEEISRRRNSLLTELSSASARLEAVNVLYEKSYEDNATGKIDDAWFSHLSSRYSQEKESLHNRISSIRKELETLNEDIDGQNRFIASVR